ncbi:MAG: hypothetical protein ACPLWB_03020 [Caldisericia bacterium]
MKDTEVIYRILAKVFDELDKRILYKKIISLSEKEDDEIEDYIDLVKKVKEFDEI